MEERLVLFLWDTREVGHRLGRAFSPTAPLVRPDLQDTAGSWKGPLTKNSGLVELFFLTSGMRRFWDETSGEVSSICLPLANIPAGKDRI